MPIIATCGHTLTEDEGLGCHIRLKTYDKRGDPAVAYVTYCKSCMNISMKDDTYIWNDDDELDWLNEHKI